MDAIAFLHLLASLATIGFTFYLIERRMFPDKQINHKTIKNTKDTVPNKLFLFK